MWVESRKSVKDIELLKGGVFTGKGDSRSMRRVLTYVRDVAIEEAFTALEYRELLKRQISQTARAAVHPRRVTTQPALIQELRREVSSFLSLYGQGDSGKLDSWKSLLFLSQGKSEKVATFAQRFDDAYNDAVCLGNVIDDAQAALQFASALNEQWSISAATLIAAGVTSLADLTSRLVAEEKLFKHSVNVKVSVGNVDSTGGKTIFVSSTQRVGGQATKEDGVRSCFYCHQPGHLKADCPQLRAKRQNKPDPIGKDQTAKSVPKEGTDKVTSVASIGVVKSNDMESDIFSPSTRMVSVCGTGTAEHASPKIDHKALFDTGSVNNFISRNLVDLLQSSSIELEVNPLDGKTIKLADGSLRESMGVISLLIGVDGVSRSLSFYVLSSLCPDLIIGWDGMCTLGVIVKTQQNEIVCTGAVFGEKKEDSEEPQCLARMAKGSSPAILGTDDFHHDPFSELIISESYWYHLPSAPGYRIRVRRLREGEQKDTEKQVFVFELDLKGATKPTTTTPRTSNYSERLISRLSEEDRELFYAEVDGYLSRGWWQEEIPSPQGTDNSLPPITVFPVKAPGKALSSTPIRPCCDARAYNNLAEPAGYLGADISSLTSRLLGAYRKGDSLYMLDCIRAFYRLRTNWFLPLMVGRKRFWSNRVIFGISAGPSCLEFAMTFLLRYVAALDPSLSSVRFDVISGCCKVAGSWIYLDDVTLMGNGADGKLERFYKLFVETAEKFGLYFPPEKQNYLSPFKASGSVTHLGSLWSIVDDHLQCSCRRDIKGFQQLFSEPGKSKRDYFAIGGKLVDYPNDHARARLASDLLRSIIGGFQTPWDERVQLGEGEARQVDTLLNVLKEDFDTPCSHLSATGDVAILECDASAAGYGYIFSCGSYHASRAKAFRTNQLAWHVNRKEAWCIIQGLLSILPFLEEYCPSSTGVSCPLTLKVVGDSKSALAWACDNRSNVRSVERLAIRRMLNTLDDIRAMFDKMNIRLEFVRVPGSSNLGADELSRLLLKWKVCPCEGTKPDSTSDLSALCSLSLMVEGANEDEEILKNGGKEVCQSLMSLETSPPATVVQWLLSLQKCDPFINSVREFLVEGKKDAYLERLLRDHGRQYELNHCGLVVECRYTDNLEGWPRKFVSDGGRNFTSKLTKTMFCREGVLQDWSPYCKGLTRKIEAINELAMQKEMSMETSGVKPNKKCFKIGDLVRRSNKEVKDDSVYEVMSCGRHSVSIRRQGDVNSLPVKEQVRNLVLAQVENQLGEM
ncbi:hypothetical protein Pmar_PMAR025841 [Perkinsus marinus ATCC 50983]|uniref:CCHC-type domain-containing protein n=1 Tax=Perkinsus marinus (strain ATCC 50983 / TXsc) TaxID=423536 RepID=C5LUV3_PERM5|nr:hypothetical protein Pmar_PMAR025841 [Perkinsus marinus ATCC 50983]EEQ99453.1 hypothetical protein Pmar_PMAR025841 [Perkinsus marinus ATCC 50983]|eukprot:XP_002766736.1 hypothetical protein Pmar_PMAR025841 [Perkinsus marinus ATCC 50983]